MTRLKRKNVNNRRKGALERLLKQPEKKNPDQHALVVQQIATLESRIRRYPMTRRNPHNACYTKRRKSKKLKANDRRLRENPRWPSTKFIAEDDK